MNWINRAGAMALLLSLSACSSIPTGTEQAAGPWRQQIDNLLADPALEGAQVSLSVRDASSGKTLYQHEPRRRGVPASSLKLLTSAAAMSVLGADYRFVTELRSNAAPSAGVLNGDLYLRGGGDPSMTPATYRELAARLARSGVRTVRGDLLLDDSWFDARRLGTEWANDDESEPYAAQISALNIALDDHYNVGSVRLTASARAGARPSLQVEPANALVQVIDHGGSGAFTVEREHGSNRLDVSGELAPGAVESRWTSVWEPTALVADVFRQALAEQGIVVQGQTRLGVVTPPGATLLAEQRSMPLAELIKPLLKQSNNGIAEVLLKSMGQQTAHTGTAEAGIAAVAGFLASQGIDAEQLRQFDGSGLSRRNLISAQTFTDLLIAARRQPWFTAWYAALPIAGTGDRQTGGTLRNRLKGTAAQNNLHAKTGSMGAVSSLTGYLTTDAGRLLVVSMVSNNFLTSEGRVKRLEDQLVRALLVSTD